ncbi:MAG: aminoglycoside nucleotidyltransferase [Rhodococcus sp.]|nr:aminoglycoside nucleotidyltransferase [Rhodococcus sp. (in: high G+C Gram-positive bacteria)]
MHTHMSELEVMTILDRLEGAGVTPWIDGGWGVDALLGRQTRAHGDLDIVIEQHQETAARVVLAQEGFAEVPMWFSTAVHTVWHHDDGRALDLHVVVLDEEGGGVYGDEGVYPAEGFEGRGTIGGRKVRCISAPVQIEFHRGYEERPQDRHDVLLLCQAFDLDIPNEYRN